MQMRVARRLTIETVLLLSWFTRGADTPADQGEEAPFFPDLKPRRGDTPEHMHWTEGTTTLEASRRGKYPGNTRACREKRCCRARRSTHVPRQRCAICKRSGQPMRLLTQSFKVYHGWALHGLSRPAAALPRAAALLRGDGEGTGPARQHCRAATARARAAACPPRALRVPSA